MSRANEFPGWFTRTAAGKQPVQSALDEETAARQKIVDDVAQLDKRREVEHNRLRPIVEKAAQRVRAAEEELLRIRQECVVAQSTYSSTVGLIESQLRDLRKQLRRTITPEMRAQIEVIEKEWSDLAGRSDAFVNAKGLRGTDAGRKVELALNRAREHIERLYEAAGRDLGERIETVRAALRLGIYSAIPTLDDVVRPKRPTA